MFYNLHIRSAIFVQIANKNQFNQRGDKKSHQKSIHLKKRQKRHLRTKMRKERRKTKHKKELKTRLEANKKHIKNLSDKKLTNDQVNSLAKGLKYIPTPVKNEMQIKSNSGLSDFDHFARRMLLEYIFFGENTEPHPFHVKSTWEPQVTTIPSP